MDNAATQVTSQQKLHGAIRPCQQLSLFEQVVDNSICHELTVGDQVVNRYFPFWESATVVHLYTITPNTEYPVVEVEFRRNSSLRRTNMFEYQLVKVFDFQSLK